jgi:hypothetical protein
MSWNVHRLPGYLRKAAKKETLPARIKHRKRRKFVRKKKEDGSKPKKLSTHIFHAKRMQMQTLFGYQLVILVKFNI